MTIHLDTRAGTGPPATLAPHGSSCRLAAEVASRLFAIQKLCRWKEVTPEEVLRGVEKLAGYAGVHLGVVLEVGCDCAEHERGAAA